MICSRKQLSVLFVIYIVLHGMSTDGIKTRSWTNYFGRKGFLQDRSFLASPGQVYGYCNETNVQVHWYRFKLFCTFAIETTEAIDSPEHLRICDFSLVSNVTNKNESFLLSEIIALTQYKAILKIEGTESNLFFILNFTNCKAKKAKLDIGITLYKICAPLEDTFDIVYLDPQTCPGHVCRIILDTEGEVISDRHSWIEDNSSIINVVNSPTIGRMVIDEYRNDSWIRWVRVYTTGNNGFIEILKEYAVEEADPNADYERIITSATYKLVSVCSKLNMILTCGQFDLAGNLKFDVTLLLNKVARVHSLSVHNLPRGGFLLLIDGCLKNYRGICSFRDRTFIIERLDVVGQFVGSLMIQRGFRAYLDYMHVFESKRHEICLSNAYNTHDNSSKVTLDIICLKDDDFYVQIPWPNTVGP